MNKWLSDEEIEGSENPVRVPSVYSFKLLCAQAKEANRLRAGLEAAYREGWRTGYHSGLSDGHPLNSPRCDEDQDWDDSDARKLLEGEN